MLPPVAVLRLYVRSKEASLPRFDAYLTEVQQRMRLAPIDLIRAWTAAEIAAVEGAIRTAVTGSGIVGAMIPNFDGTNQAKGNKAADFFIAAISEHIPQGTRIIAATGAGYPDRIFIVGATGHCMELKATSHWRDGDSNRRVLTSSPDKMIRLVNSGDIDTPPAHLICTVLYREENSSVQGVRLDFLEPDSEVSIRLEASTSQRLLTQGGHQKFMLS